MTAQQLKASILQLAVQGKLVPQDPNDEPAHLLLERIRKEKARLIRAGKAKKEKSSSRIFRQDNAFFEKVNGEVQPLDPPFNIPASWEWVRLENAFIIEMGQSPEGNSVSEDNAGVEFHQGKVFFGETYLTPSDQYTSSPTKIAPRNSLLLCVRAPVGKVNITSRKICIGRGLCALIPLAEMPILFAFYLLSVYENIFVRQATGTTFRAITAETVKNQLIPLPPLGEQKRIVEAIEGLLPYVKRYEEAEKQLTSLNASFPEALKKAILQEAVQGKLVPQDPNDEPAHLLLERIRKEKARLIRAGKAKKEKSSSRIFRQDNAFFEEVNGEVRCIDDELPFDIPDNWSWCRLGCISSYAEVKQKVNAANTDPTLWGLDLEDIEKGGKLVGHKTVGERKSCGDKTVFTKGDILYSKLRPYLLKVLVAPDSGICTSEIVPFRVYGGIVPAYIVNYLKSPYVDSRINSITYGVKMPRVGTSTMISLLVPLPPLGEQKRIVQRIEELLPLVKGLDPLSATPNTPRRRAE